MPHRQNNAGVVGWKDSVGASCRLALLLLLYVSACGDRMIISDYRSVLGSKPLGENGEHRQRRGAHAGVDIRARVGQEVIASAPGIVASVSHGDDAGTAVMVRHPGKQRFVLYLHLASADVVPFERIERGQRLGTVGLFPYSGGAPHVHVEVCTEYCPRGHQSGDLKGTERPLFAGCFRGAKSEWSNKKWLTYPVACD